MTISAIGFSNGSGFASTVLERFEEDGEVGDGDELLDVSGPLLVLLLLSLFFRPRAGQYRS